MDREQTPLARSSSCFHGPPPPRSSPRGTGKRPLPRSVSVPVLSVLGAFVAFEGHGLWKEWQSLRSDLQTAETQAFVGYHNIYPKFSTARHPKDWFRSEGDAVFLWAGWEPGKQHLWFKAKKGELDQSHLSEPIGRDVFRGIEDPWIETGGGSIWERVPSDAPVVGRVARGFASAYPLLVLQRVCLVHDTIKDHPYLAGPHAHRPPGERSIGVYDLESAGPQFPPRDVRVTCSTARSCSTTARPRASGSRANVP